jgi:nicotinamide-nucleotide amidase
VSVEREVDATAQLVSILIQRGLTVAVAESLTGGLVAAQLVSVPGVSAVFNGGVVAYNTALKASVLGVDAALLHQFGPVHPLVAQQMAENVREVLSIDGIPARVGLSTTGVAGPGAQDGHPAGTVLLGIAIDKLYFGLELHLQGDREAIRSAVVSELFSALKIKLESN